MTAREQGAQQTHWSADGGRPRVFSGHESFALRYGWLPKLYAAVTQDPKIFSNDERAILALGLGRNMVKSIRFWGDAFGITAAAGGGEVRPTRFGERLLGPRGRDSFLESSESLWRLHWNVNAHAGLGAWSVAFLDLVDHEISRLRLVELTHARASEGRAAITQATAASHVDIFIRTYDSGRSGGADLIEETLSCPLQELGLLTVAEVSGQQVVRFARGRKVGLGVAAFAYALHDFWAGTAAQSQSLSLRSLMLSRRSPGTVFRLDEGSLHDLLDLVCRSSGLFQLREDGVGGIDVVATRPDALPALEEFAWA